MFENIIFHNNNHAFKSSSKSYVETKSVDDDFIKKKMLKLTIMTNHEYYTYMKATMIMRQWNHVNDDVFKHWKCKTSWLLINKLFIMQNMHVKLTFQIDVFQTFQFHWIYIIIWTSKIDNFAHVKQNLNTNEIFYNKCYFTCFNNLAIFFIFWRLKHWYFLFLITMFNRSFSQFEVNFMIHTNIKNILYWNHILSIIDYKKCVWTINNKTQSHEISTKIWITLCRQISKFQIRYRDNVDENRNVETTMRVINDEQKQHA